MTTTTLQATSNPIAAVGDEVLVSTEVASRKTLHSVTQLADGGHVVVWQSNDQDGDRGGIFGQRFAVDGTPVGGEFQVNESGLDDQRRPFVDATSDGGFVVVWTNRDTDARLDQVVSQKFDANGDRVGAEAVVVEGGTPGLTVDSVTTLSDGSYLVTWQGFSPLDVGARLFNSDGTPAGGAFVPHEVTEGAQRDSSVVALPDGGFAMIWLANGAFGPDAGLQLRFFDVVEGPNGTEAVPTTGSLRFDASGTTPSFGSDIAVLADGRLVVTWSEPGGDGDNDGVLARILPADLETIANDPVALEAALADSPIFQVNTTVAGRQNTAEVTALSDGGFVISWTDRSAGDADIRLQQFASDGTPIGEELIVNTVTANDQAGPQLVEATDGFVAVWISEQTSDVFTDTDIKLQRFAFDADTGPLVIDQSGTVVTNGVDRTGDPAVLISGSDNSFTNQTGATLTGTGPNGGSIEFDPAIEVTGSGNTIVNEAGATITGVVGVDSRGPDTTVTNAGDILGVNTGNLGSFDDGAGLRLINKRSVVENTGSIRAESADDDAVAVRVTDDSTVTNAGVIQADAGDRATGIVVSRDSTVINTAGGEIDIVGGRTGYGIDAGLIGNQIENAGSIRVSGTGGFGAFGVRANGSNTIVNTGDIDISTFSRGAGIWTFGGGNTVDNQGTITVVATGTGARADGFDLTSKLAVNSGTMTVEAAGGRATGVRYLNDGQFTNDGQISVAGAEAFGVTLRSRGTVTNNGTIEVVATGGPSVGIEFESSTFSTNEIVNTGTITADIAIRDVIGFNPPRSGVQTVTNSGTVNGQIVLNQRDDTVTNSGTINGDVFLGDGDDVFDNALGTVSGAIVGEFGNDTITNSGTITGDVFLGEGDNVFDGVDGTVNGSIFGGSGNDTITNRGTITGNVFLGEGDNVFDGSLGTLNGAVVGEAGNDTLSGGLGAQGLFGGAGDDILSGNAGDDVLIGGAGADTMDGGDGLDTLDYSASLAGVQVNLGDATNIPEAPVKAGAGTAFGGDAEGDTFSNIEAVIGSAFDDFVFGSANGEGIALGAGDDLAQGGAGNDSIDGGDGNDILSGDAGNDLLIGGAGADTINGGDGRDTLDYSASQAGVQVNLGDASNAGAAPIKAGAGTAFGGDAEGDTFSDIEAVVGSEFDDFVYGNAEGNQVLFLGGDDVFDNRSSRSADDVLDMGAGDDVARTGNGDDLISGGDGNDELRGERGDDTLYGDAGDDLLVGDRGRDVLDGGAGNDRLFGGRSSDVLNGGGGDDDLYGGSGRDVFVFDADGGNDTIFDFSTSRRSGDVIDLTAFDSLNTFDDVLSIATEVGNDTVLTLDLTSTLTLVGIDVNQLNSNDFVLV